MYIRKLLNAVFPLFLVINMLSCGENEDNNVDKTPKQLQIAFVSDRDGNSEIYVMDADGKNQRRLTDNPAEDGCPSWSPDGQKIAFHSGRDKKGLYQLTNYEIYVTDVDGKNQRRLTNNPANDCNPSWSPDGQMIAFDSTDEGKGSEIYIIDADGKNLHKLTANGANDEYPAFSR